MKTKDNIIVSEVRFTAAPQGDVDSGLLGFVDFVLNGSIRLSNISLRRTRDGRLALSYPLRRDSVGHDHFVVRPIHDEAREQLERQIIGALGHI